MYGWPDLEEGVLVADGDELPVALSSLVSHAGQMGVSLLTVAPHHLAVVKLILPEISISTDQLPFCNGYRSRVFHCWMSLPGKVILRLSSCINCIAN